MGNILGFLNGKKTFIVAALMFIASGGQALGWWSQANVVIVDSLLAPLGLAFLRSGINNSKK